MCVFEKRQYEKWFFYSVTLHDSLERGPLLLIPCYIFPLSPSELSSCPPSLLFFFVSLFLPRKSICVYTAFIHKLVNTGLNRGKQRFIISLLIYPLTVKSCLNSEGPTQERMGRSIMSALWPFTFFLVILSLSSICSLSFCLFLSLLSHNNLFLVNLQQVELLSM